MHARACNYIHACTACSYTRAYKDMQLHRHKHACVQRHALTNACVNRLCMIQLHACIHGHAFTCMQADTDTQLRRCIGRHADALHMITDMHIHGHAHKYVHKYMDIQRNTRTHCKAVAGNTQARTFTHKHTTETWSVQTLWIGSACRRPT
jgi:hypothetical protein